LDTLYDEYGPDKFLKLAYHANWGGDPFGTAETYAKFSWYGISGTPTVFFDGTEEVSGGGADMYPYYKPIVESELARNAPVSIDVLGSISHTSSFAKARIEVTDPISYSNLKVRMNVVENNIYNPGDGDYYNGVVRDILPQESVTLSSVGDTVTVGRTFTMDPSWDITNSTVIVFVQDDATKEILNAAKLADAFDFRFATEESGIEVAPLGAGMYETWIHNEGASDDTIDLDFTATMPVDWHAVICVQSIYGFACEEPPVTIPVFIASGESLLAQIEIYPSSAGGLGELSLEGTSRGNSGIVRSQAYAVFSDIPSILCVDDDAGAAYGDVLKQAIIDAGYNSRKWDQDVEGIPGAAEVANYDMVFWTTAQSEATLDAEEQTLLKDYFNNGGYLFLASQDYLGEADLDTSFVRDCLGVNPDSIAVNTGNFFAYGVAGTFTDGMLHAVHTPPFTNRSDSYVPVSGGQVIYTSYHGDPKGSYFDTATGRSVLLVFPFEAISTSNPDPDNQATLVYRVIQHFLGPTGTRELDIALPAKAELYQNYPNPFNPKTTIRFAVPGSDRASVSLDVFNVMGQKVTALVDGELDPGVHVVDWDGTDSGGSPVSNGIYFYRLKMEDTELTRRMMVLK
jgi:hypothetical protein